MGDSTKTSKRFSLCFLLTFFLTCVMVTTLHFLGNPDQLFDSPLVPARSQRAWKSRQLDRLIAQGKTPQVVVLGSSRMRQVSPAQIKAITGMDAFNNSIGGAGCVEMLAQLRSLLRREIKPKLLIVGLDERALLGMYEPHVGRAVEDWALFRELPVQEKFHHGYEAFTQIDFRRTHVAIRNLTLGPAPPTENARTMESFICEDGYSVYAQQTISRHNRVWKPGELEGRLLGFNRIALRRTRSNYDRREVDSDQIDAFREIARLCRQQRIPLKVMMTPLQPEHQKAVISSRTRLRIRDAIREIREACRARRAKFYDFRSLSSFNGDQREFWDPWHVTPVNMKRMVNRLFDLDAETVHAAIPDDMDLIQNPPASSTVHVW